MNNCNKMNKKAVSDIAATFKKYVPSPAAAAILAGLPVYFVGRKLWSPVTSTAASLFRPVGVQMFGGGDKGALLYNQVVQGIQNDEQAKSVVPTVAAAGTAAGVAWLLANKDQPGYGLFKWGSDMHKKGAFYMDDNPTYEQALDWDKPLNANAAVSLFTNDPYMQYGDTYAKHMGTAIITNAAMQGHTTQPTLGGIFDSAAQKIDSKLSLGGLLHVGKRALLSNGLAKLFTGALDTMYSLPQNAKDNLISAGTWAGTISAILD